MISGDSLHNKHKTHCKLGHEFTDENTEYRQVGKYQQRRCRECHRNYERDRYNSFNEEEKKIVIQRALNRNRKHKKDRNLVNRCRNYGITVDQYTAMEVAQNFCCAICNQELPLSIDHNHLTGKVRQLLCKKCNTMLGYAREDPEILRAGAEYLEAHNVVTKDGIRSF